MKLPYIYQPCFKNQPIHCVLFNNAPQAWSYCVSHNADMFTHHKHLLLDERYLKKRGYSLKRYKLVEV